jgi:hypothetical protein
VLINTGHGKVCLRYDLFFKTLPFTDPRVFTRYSIRTMDKFALMYTVLFFLQNYVVFFFDTHPFYADNIFC